MCPKTHDSAPSSPNCIAVIGDLVDSRRLSDEERGNAQALLEQLLEAVNQRSERAVLAKFLVTIGDEFQGLLTDPTIIPDFVWTIVGGLSPIQVRFGFGFGPLSTELKEYALGMDGPVWHQARKAIELSKGRGRSGGGVFLGFGERTDLVLNGLASTTHYLEAAMSDRQREVVDLLRAGMSQTEVAEKLGVKQPTISDHARAAGWSAVQDGEAGWRAALSPFDTSEQWDGLRR